MKASKRNKDMPGCTWQEKPICQDRATHWHPAYGELCGYHAREVVEYENRTRGFSEVRHYYPTWHNAESSASP